MLQDEVLRTGGPFRYREVWHVGVERRKYGGVGVELRDAFVGRPGLEPLYAGGVLLGLEDRPHDFGETLFWKAACLGQ